MFQTPHLPKTLAAAAIALAGQAHALVPVTPANITGTGVMSASCASLRGSGNGLTINGAIDDGLFANATSCTGQAATGPMGTANSSASRSNAGAAATTHGLATLGGLHLGSQLDALTDAALFPVAISQAAFGDNLTVHLAGHDGEAGVLQVALHVSGVLDASGPAGSAAFRVGLTKDDQQLGNGQGGFQGYIWSVASFAGFGPPSEHLAVNETVLFNVPVVIGTSFEMVALGMSIAGTRSQTGAGHATSDFDNTVLWEGVQGLKLNGALVQGYTLTSGSGVDWMHTTSAVPEPSAWLLLTAGLGLVAGRRRRSAR